MFLLDPGALELVDEVQPVFDQVGGSEFFFPRSERVGIFYPTNLPWKTIYMKTQLKNLFMYVNILDLLDPMGFEYTLI